MIVAVVFAFSLAVVGAQNFNGGDSAWYCDGLKEIDCSRELPHPKCGTNGVTYLNFCSFSKAHCNETSIQQKHDGPCSPAETIGSTTTLSPGQIVHGSQIILDFFCIRLDHTGCHHSMDETICGTDGVTYSDFCEYEKARCGHRELHVQSMGPCKA